jgi:hypothetical protein
MAKTHQKKDYREITVRFTDSVKAAAMKRAADEHRSFSAHLEHLLVKDLRANGYLPSLRAAKTKRRMEHQVLEAAQTS